MTAILLSIRSIGNCGTWYDDDPPPDARSATGCTPVAGIILPPDTVDEDCGGGDEAIISSSSLSVRIKYFMLNFKHNIHWSYLNYYSKVKINKFIKHFENCLYLLTKISKVGVTSRSNKRKERATIVYINIDSNIHLCDH